MVEKPEDNILAGQKVLDLTDASGALCIKKLAGMGEEVI